MGALVAALLLSLAPEDLDPRLVEGPSLWGDFPTITQFWVQKVT